jgi:hypothetical protein
MPFFPGYLVDSYSLLHEISPSFIHFFSPTPSPSLGSILIFSQFNSAMESQMFMLAAGEFLISGGSRAAARWSSPFSKADRDKRKEEEVRESSQIYNR